MPAKPKTKTQPAKASSGLGKAAKAAMPAKTPTAKAVVKAAPTVKRKPSATKKTTAVPVKAPKTKPSVTTAETVPAKAPKTKPSVTAAETVPAKSPRPKPTAAAAEIVISTDDIALRAYFIAERRRSMGWGGDEHSDWVEAESQLKAEAKRKRLRD